FAQQGELGAHRVADGDPREPGPPRPAVGRGRRRPGAALAAAQHVGGDHEVPVGVECQPGADDAFPPAWAGVPGAFRAYDVAVAGEGVQHEDRVGAVLVETAPRLVGQADPGKFTPGLQQQRFGQFDPAPVARRVPFPPRAGRGKGRGGVVTHWYALAARSPASKAARRSSTCSKPTDSRTRPGATPLASCSSGVSWLCVVLAGWTMRLRTSPMLTSWLNSSVPSTKARPASIPPCSSKETIAPAPLGRYFFAAS